MGSEMCIRDSTHGIKVDEGLVFSANEKHINYCDMLRKSFNDDKVFSDFVSLEFYDGSAIQHASVVHSLYKYYGSNNFWDKTKSLNLEEKNRVDGYLEFDKKLSEP